MVKKRVPLQVSPEFREKLKELKRKVNATNKVETSMRELTEEISKSAVFESIENEILRGGVGVDLRIKFDGRRK